MIVSYNLLCQGGQLFYESGQVRKEAAAIKLMLGHSGIYGSVK